MFDVKIIRDDPAAFDEARKRRCLAPVAGEIVTLDELVREAKSQLQAIQERHNKLSKQIGAAKSKGEDASEAMERVSNNKDMLKAAEEVVTNRVQELNDVLAGEPNLPESMVPAGANESANQEIKQWGEPRTFNFEARDHVDIGEGFGLMDFETAARMSGARFVVVSGALARMERALAQFMLDTHTGEFGYTEVNPPLLVREQAAFGTGNLPKFADDLFRTTDDYWLIPTAEMVLTNLVAEQIVDADSLPLRFTAFTPCFRSEAGAAGKDTRGMIRQHQFTKVEMVSISHPDQSDTELERMLGCAEAILQRLELPYRVVLLSGGDMGFSAQKTFDIEVWLPGQDRYREISSCSNCGDFQARRMKARFRRAGEKGTQFVHTLNGSGLAIGRSLIAVLENYQQSDGSVTVPDVLRPYMGGVERIEPAG